MLRPVFPLHLLTGALVKRAISCPFHQPHPQSLGTHAVPEPAAKNGVYVSSNSIETNVSMVQTKEDMLICRDPFSDGICVEQVPPERSFMYKLWRKSVKFSQICATQMFRMD